MNQISDERLDYLNQASRDRSTMFYWQADRPMSIEESALIFGDRQSSITDAEIAKLASELLTATDGYGDSDIASVEGGDKYTLGSVNINRKLTLDDGRQLVCRIHPPGLRNGYFSVEAVAWDLARHHSIPAPVPVAVAYGSTRFDCDMIISELAPGENMKLRLAENSDEEAELVRNAGVVLAKIHEIPVNGFGFFDNEIARTTGELRGIHNRYRDHVLASLDSNLGEMRAAGYVTSSQVEQISQLLQTSDLIDCDSPRLIHNDFADWNMLVQDSALSAVLDWDECHGGDPIADIACWSLFFGPARLSHLIEGYREIASLPDDFDDRLHVYRLRYLVSKVALRHKKTMFKQNEFAHLLALGLEALEVELKHFSISY